MPASHQRPSSTSHQRQPPSWVLAAEASASIKEGLAVSQRVGPLSGKTIGAVAIWLLAWLVLHLVLRGRAKLSPAVVGASVVLLGLGVLGTFPTFFQLFTTE